MSSLLRDEVIIWLSSLKNNFFKKSVKTEYKRNWSIFKMLEMRDIMRLVVMLL